ncbi:MATE family efflux transporter [Thalassotalea sp. PS06]|uniref:MATE family efflux transporter n=1 Tax=Thalassotalea sp. PS06 TaxID=2594005 RepID=UPI0011620CDF|nr:MATE family efflux transporter [Thalassotalea sp. PS06]QDP02612.1 MATE family efflux transporter [Thalassotalea sp. PS06]
MSNSDASRITPQTERKALFALAIPMILSNITVPLLGLVDTGVIGHLPEAYFLGATAVGAMIITFVTWFCGFLRMSTTGLVAQAFGSEDQTQMFLVLSRGLLVALVIGILMIILQVPYINFSLALAGGSEQVQFYAHQYASVRIWGFPASLCNLVILGWLLGMHKAKYAMWLLIITNLTNLVLDLLFVIGFEWQILGIAWATIIAEYSSFALGLYFVHKTIGLNKRQRQEIWAGLKQHLLDKAQLIPFVKLNRDIVIRTLCLEICFVFITFQGARLGDTVVAANAILLNFLLLISFGLDGIAYGAEARVGRAKGAHNKKALALSVNIALIFNGLFAVFYSLLFLFLGHWFITLLTNIDSVINYAGEFLPWMVALPIIACWCYLFDGIYIGLTQAKAMRNSMVIATFGCFFPAWWLLQGYGNHGLWAAFCIFMASRGVTLGLHYYKNHHKFV